MPTSAKVFGLLVFTGVVILLLAQIVWAGWIRDYVISHGEKARFALWSAAPIADYSTAMRIAKRTGYVPWFLKLYTVMAGIGLLLFIAAIVALILTETM